MLISTDNVIIEETDEQVVEVAALKGQEGRHRDENIRVRVESVANVRMVTRTWWCCMWVRCGEMLLHDIGPLRNTGIVERWPLN